MSAFVIPALCALVAVCVFFSLAAGAARWHRTRPQTVEAARDGEGHGPHGGYVWS